MKFKYNKTPVNKFIGLYKEIKDDKNNFTHYAISVQQTKEIENYITSLENDISMLNSNISSLKTENETNLNNLTNKYNDKLIKLENLHSQKIDDLNSIIQEYKKELDRLNNLNSNLLRISKERANQERNLRPKKSHKGFVVLNRQSLYYKLYSNIKPNTKSKQVNYIEFPCFKIRIQTPFNSSISFDLIKNEMINNFFDFIKKLGVDIWYEYDDIISQPIYEIQNFIFNNEYNNFIFKEHYIANLKSNLWEIEVYTKNDVIN